MRVNPISFAKLNQSVLKNSSNFKYSNLNSIPFDDFSFTGKTELDKDDKEEIKFIKKELKKQGANFKNCSTEQILNAMGINCKKDCDGLLIIDRFDQPGIHFTFEDLGINENDLFKDIKRINHYAHFKNSKATDLGSLQVIGGDADFYGSELTSLGNLSEIGKSAYFTNSKIKSLGKLKYIGGDADFRHSDVKDMGNLCEIVGNAYFEGSDIEDLKKLRLIGKSADFCSSKVKSFNKLKTIGVAAFIGDSELTRKDFENVNVDYIYS